jgi:hypothetical protein
MRLPRVSGLTLPFIGGVMGEAVVGQLMTVSLAETVGVVVFALKIFM